MTARPNATDALAICDHEDVWAELGTLPPEVSDE